MSASNATIGVVLPTIGRPTLERSLASLLAQGLGPGDDVLCVIDAHHGPHEDVPARVAAFGPGFRALFHDAGASWKGAAGLNWGYLQVDTDLLLVFSDDDVYRPGLFTRLRAEAKAHPFCPLLFQSLSANQRLSWEPGSPCLVRNRIGGSSIAIPRPWRRPYAFTPGQGATDFIWMCAIIQEARSYGHRPVWIEDTFHVARPKGVYAESTAPGE